MTVFAGDVLTATAAPVYGDLTSTRTWQWLRGSTSIAGATTTTYRATDADVGSTLAVNQIETNFLGSTTATSAATATVGAWSPTSLFASSEPGVWYDTDDYTTMFQDSAGTTPVTGANQPVGLLLDKSKGLVLGPELVTNGGFDTSSNWAQAAGTTGSISISSGVLTVTRSGGFTAAGQSISFVSGRTYKISVRARRTSGTGAIAIVVRTANDIVGTARITVTPTPTGSFAEYSAIYVCSNTETAALQLGVATADGVIEFDDASVKELAGNHATQSTAASRPTTVIRPLNAERRNLLLQTENFGSASWVRDAFGTASAPSVISTTEINPLGAATASLVRFNTGAGTTSGDASRLLGNPLLALNAVAHIGSIWAKVASGTAQVEFAISGAAGSTSTVTLTTSWQRVLVNGTPSSPFSLSVVTRGNAAPGVKDIYLWGAQLETGSTATAYQKVVTTNEWYDPAVPSYRSIQFDGVDDFLVTPTITPGTDKAQVFAGVRKLSDAAVATIAEHSINSGSTSGTWGLFASGYSGGGAAYAANLLGSQRSNFDATTFTSPTTNVLSATFDIAQATRAAEIGFKVNGSVPTLTGGGFGDAGTGNFTAQAIYIGRRGGTSLPLNGILTSLVVRFGANLSTSVINRAEYYVSNKTGVTL